MKVKLGEVAEIIMGQSPDSSSYNYEDGLPFFQGNADFGEYYPTIRILCNKPKKIANKYDVLISVRAPVGAVNIANNICAIGRGLAIIRTNANTVNHRYLFYLLKYHRRYIENLGTGSTFKAISKPILNDLCFTIHDIQTQKEIVAVLDKVTSLISMRKGQLEKLDILVKSKFIEMFGDPVLNPKGWEKKKLGEVCSSIVRGPFGSALKKEYFVPYSLGVYKVYEQKNAIKQDCNIGSYYISEEKFLTLKRFECKAGDIIMSCSGTVGKMYTLPEDAHKGIINQALMKMTLNGIVIDKIFKIYFGLAVENLVLNGSGIKNISSVSYLKNIEIQAPPLDLQNQFAEFVEQVEKSKDKIKSSLNQLETLYSALMQEYFG